MSSTTSAGPNVRNARGLSARHLVVLLMVLSGLFHVELSSQHFVASTGHGVAFASAGIALLVLAVALLLSARRRVVLVGLAINVAAVCMRVVVRLSASADASHVHSPGLPELELAGTVAELAAIVALLSLLNGRLRQWAGNAVLATGAILVTLRISGVL